MHVRISRTGLAVALASQLARFLVALFLVAPGPAGAGEPAREFLEALRERKYYDLALDYLDQLATSPLAPVEIKESLHYEKGVTLVEASRAQRDPALRTKYLDDAQQMLRQFIGQHSEHPRANAARSQLGNLIVERARMKVEESKRGNRAQLLKDARGLYEEAFQVFNDLQEDVRIQLERIPKVLDTTDRAQAALAERRKQLRADYLQTLLLAAAIREETADTAKGAPDYDKLLSEAASQYDDIYTKYRTRLAGLYARMYQGRANQKLGKLRDALGFYVELLEQPDTPEEFRALKTKTMKQAMECWLDPSQSKFAEAIKRGSDWIAKARPTEDREPDWLYIRLLLARAHKMRAADAESKNDSRTSNQSRTEARQIAQFVARYESEHQAAAQQMVAELGGPDRTGEKPDPRNFAEAKAAGQEALNSIGPATLVVQQIPARIAAAKDDQTRTQLERQLAKAKQTLATAHDDAMEFFQLGLKYADEETSTEDVNVVRYFLCYLYYRQQDYYDAALIGDFIARRYPGSAGARPCAKIALASYLKLYDETEGDDKSFETDRIVAIAEYTVEKWPNQPEAEDALNTLVPFMINTGELDRAQQFLRKIPESSPKRLEAELRTGQAVWRAVTLGGSELRKWEKDGAPDGTDPAARAAELDAMKSNAVEILSSAFDRAGNAGKVNLDVVVAGLSLAQAYVDSQQAEKAIAALEDDRIGPLTLVRAKHAAASAPAIVSETLKTALRAYVGSLATTGNAEAAMQKAKAVMGELKVAMGNDADGQKRLINVYVSLATDLENQLQLASPSAKEALSKGFEVFLAQLASTADDLTVLNWVGETFIRLGQGFDTGDKLTRKANDYYEQAFTTFQNILSKVNPPPRLKMQIRIRMAYVKRLQRQFGKAIDLYAELLGENQMMLNVQVEAARTYQLRAATPNLVDLYGTAIRGGRPDPGTKANVIWGWGLIAKRTTTNKEFRDTFYEARYNMALSRFKYAQRAQESKTGADRDRLLEMAEKDISLTMRLFPDLGGNKWTPKFDQLSKQIQASKGERAVGLKKFDATARR